MGTFFPVNIVKQDQQIVRFFVASDMGRRRFVSDKCRLNTLNNDASHTCYRVIALEIGQRRLFLAEYL